MSHTRSGSPTASRSSEISWCQGQLSRVLARTRSSLPVHGLSGVYNGTEGAGASTSLTERGVDRPESEVE